MLTTIESIGSATNLEEIKCKTSSNKVASDNIVDGGEATNSTKRKNQAKTTKSKILVKSKNHDFLPHFKNRKAGAGFFTFAAKLTFIQLRQAFIKAPILYHFDLESHIGLEIDILGYAIGSVLSKLFFKTRLNGVVTKTNLS